MKKACGIFFFLNALLIGLLLGCPPLAYTQSFSQFFVDKTMRVDYYHTGTKGVETISLDQVYEEGQWPGSKVNLLDTLNLGEYMVRVYDVSTASLIYSRGYSTMFNEWQSTDEANDGINRTFSETVRMPYPKRSVQVTISRRDKQMILHEVFSTVLDPNSAGDVDRTKRTAGYKVVELMKNGPPEKKVDLVVLGDGYGKADMEKLRKDAKHFTDLLFGTSPFKERKNDFNVWLIEVESRESGIDKPDKNLWKDNELGTRYYTFNTPRYILTTENRRLRDIASAVPYDFVHILCNDDRYGGGGIFNLYATCYTKTDKVGMEWQMDYVYVHEFGHSFAGLGDEYYSSQVAYTDFYKKGVEPWEPNITALVDKNNLKWKNLVDPTTPLPTPWEKTAYDSLERERGMLDRLAPDYYEKREPFYQAEQKIVKTGEHAGKAGAFEGAGYAANGLYRPSLDCRMFSLSLVGFDPVCTAAIERMIDFYSR